MNNYEAMFLLDNKEAKRDWDGLESQVQGLIKKHGGDIVLAGKWDERKLAYEIGPHKRATYYMVYFKAPPEAIAPLRRDCSLNESIVRQLILNVETIPSEIKKAEAMVEVPEVGGSGGFDRGDGDRPRYGSRAPAPPEPVIESSGPETAEPRE